MLFWLVVLSSNAKIANWVLKAASKGSSTPIFTLVDLKI